MPPSHLPEHKIAVFVRFCPPEPPFSGISSTKSRFLCAFAFRNPRFRAFRAQNLGFCARKVAKMLGKRWMGHREEVDGASGITKMTFVKLTAHSNTHCYLRRPDHSPVPGAVPKQKRTTNTCWSSSFVLLLSWRFYSAGCHLQRTGETIAPSSCSATSLPCALI